MWAQVFNLNGNPKVKQSPKAICGRSGGIGGPEALKEIGEGIGDTATDDSAPGVDTGKAFNRPRLSSNFWVIYFISFVPFQHSRKL